MQLGFYWMRDMGMIQTALRDFAEDLEWMLESHESVPFIIKRLGMSYGGIRDKINAAGRPDLLEKLSVVARQESEAIRPSNKRK